jgi:hypothetical protein
MSAATHLQQEISVTYKAAVEEVGNDPDEYLELARRAPDQDTAIRFAEKALALRAAAETYFVLGSALDSKYGQYIFSKSDSDRRGLERATETLKSAVTLSAGKDPRILYELGESLLHQYRVEEAEAEYLNASRLIEPASDDDLKKNVDGGLIMTAYLSQNKNCSPGYL